MGRRRGLLSQEGFVKGESSAFNPASTRFFQDRLVGDGVECLLNVDGYYNSWIAAAWSVDDIVV